MFPNKLSDNKAAITSSRYVTKQRFGLSYETDIIE